MSGVQEESKKGKIDISPSVLLEKMIEKQHSNKKYDQSLGKKEIVTRGKLVDWMCETGDTVRVSSECIHKAVVFLDVIMAENTISENDLQPLGVVCLLLSAKMTEKDRPVAQIKAMFQKRMNIHPSQIRKYEMQVLSLLRWDLQCVTAADFVQFFVHQGVIFTNDKALTSCGYKFANKKMALTIRQYTEFFADMCLQEYSFTSMESLHLAASIIAASRKMIKLATPWTSELLLLTGLQYPSISDTVEQINKHYNKLFNKPKAPLPTVRENKENNAPKVNRIGNTSRNSSGLRCAAIRYF